ncbi:MAG: hypothetical protein P1P66_02595 [Treponema pedis]
MKVTGNRAYIKHTQQKAPPTHKTSCGGLDKLKTRHIIYSTLDTSINHTQKTAISDTDIRTAILFHILLRQNVKIKNTHISAHNRSPPHEQLTIGTSTIVKYGLSIKKHKPSVIEPKIQSRTSAKQTAYRLAKQTAKLAEHAKKNGGACKTQHPELLSGLSVLNG